MKHGECCVYSRNSSGIWIEQSGVNMNFLADPTKGRTVGFVVCCMLFYNFCGKVL